MYHIYSKPSCPYCVKLKDFLSRNNLDYQEIDVSDDVVGRAFILNAGFTTVPQLYLDNKYIGDCDTSISILNAE